MGQSHKGVLGNLIVRQTSDLPFLVHDIAEFVPALDKQKCQRIKIQHYTFYSFQKT